MRCKANQCPLNVKFITTWEIDSGKQMPKWGVCRYYRHASPHDWPETTRRIILLEGRIKSFKARFEEKDPSFMARPGELYGEWFDRYEGNLRKIILGGDVGKVDAAANFAHIIQLLSTDQRAR